MPALDALRDYAVQFMGQCLPVENPLHAASSILTGRLQNQDPGYLSSGARHRLTCFFLASPLSLLDTTYHVLWGTTKLTLLASRGALYHISSGRYGHFLQQDVSREQVLLHAKKASLFALGTLFGSICGAIHPKVVLLFHSHFNLTAVPPPSPPDTPPKKEPNIFFPSNETFNTVSSHLHSYLYANPNPSWQEDLHDRTTCFVLASPLCLVDTVTETFWCVLKSLLFLPAQAIYKGSSRRYGKVLYLNTSKDQIVEHARKASLFAIGTLFGSITGAIIGPHIVLEQQRHYQLTALLPKQQQAIVQDQRNQLHRDVFGAL